MQPVPGLLSIALKASNAWIFWDSTQSQSPGERDLARRHARAAALDLSAAASLLLLALGEDEAGEQTADQPVFIPSVRVCYELTSEQLDQMSADARSYATSEPVLVVAGLRPQVEGGTRFVSYLCLLSQADAWDKANAKDGWAPGGRRLVVPVGATVEYAEG